MQQAVSILRVSTKKQLNEGEGIENQRRGNNAYIDRKKYRLLGEFVLAETADNKDRAEFGEVLEYLARHRREIDVVVFWKMDRISRAGVGSYYALKAYLAKHGIRIEFATEQIDSTPTGELMESILAATARFENRLRVDRTIGVEKILTMEGYWCRAAPTGFVNCRDHAGKPILRPDPERWELLREGLLRQLSGNHKLSEVVVELQRLGLTSRYGKPLSKQSWEKICRNPLYGGYIRGTWTDGELVRAKFDSPLSPVEWLKLQESLDSRNTIARRLPRKALNPEFPLRRFLRCPECDLPVRGYPAVNRQGMRFCYYDCKNAACRFRIPAEEVHKLFVDQLARLTPTPDVLATFRKVVLQSWEKCCRDVARESLTLSKSVIALRKERESILDLMKRARGSDNLSNALQAEFDRVDRELKQVTLERNDSELREHEVEAVVGHCLYFLEHASELWEKWPVEAKNKLQAMIYPEGMSFAVLEGKRTPVLSEIHVTIAELASSDPMAAPSWRMTNSCLQALIAWYRLLRELPFPGSLAVAG